jgi:hypothetical protein
MRDKAFLRYGLNALSRAYETNYSTRAAGAVADSVVNWWS